MTSILIIEDSEETAFILDHLLCELGCHTQVCGKAGPGLELLKAGGFDLVLMDLNLPDISGIEATRQARTFCDIPIVGLSAALRNGQREEGLAAGMNDLQEKTLKRDDLQALLQDYGLGRAPN